MGAPKTQSATCSAFGPPRPLAGALCTCILYLPRDIFNVGNLLQKGTRIKGYLVSSGAANHASFPAWR